MEDNGDSESRGAAQPEQPVATPTSSSAPDKTAFPKLTLRERAKGRRIIANDRTIQRIVANGSYVGGKMGRCVRV